MAAPRPAKVAKVSSPIKLPPDTAAPRPAKVSPPNKFPVLDERLRISSSKVQPLVSASHDVPLDRPVAHIGGQKRADFFKSLRESAKSAVRALFADFF